MPRPPGFERAAVLSDATDIFWRRGYGATSVADLVTATGLRPGSLYAAFGSKKGLFLEVLDRYHSGFMADAEQRVARAASPLAAIRALFDGVVDASAADGDRRGCLAVNALLELAGHDEDIARKLDEQGERLRRLLERQLAGAVAAGEIGRCDPPTMSVFLLNSLWGMRVMCKNNPDRETLAAVVHGVMAALGAARTN